MLKSFKDLLVWQKSYALALKVYEVTSDFPAREAYGLTNQMRRAAVSVPSNISLRATHAVIRLSTSGLPV